MGTIEVDMDTPDPGTCEEYAACGGIGDCGGNVGLRLPPLPSALPACNGSESFAFPGADWCQAEVTVLIGAAEWCGPCRTESTVLRDNLLEVFRDEPVRVVQVLTQDIDFATAGQAACDRWINDFYSVDSFGDGTDTFAEPGKFNLVLDPEGLTRVYEFGALPNTLLIDGDGIIAARLTGLEGTAANPIAGLVDRVQALLDEAAE
ncbi:MAG: hypothetical protein AAF447_06385 [Myxococcota bacterium]